MATVFYQRVVKELSGFVGEKADGVLSRQLKHCNKTPDNFEKGDLGAVMKYVVGASTLYLSDPSKEPVLADKLRNLSQ